MTENAQNQRRHNKLKGAGSTSGDREPFYIVGVGASAGGLEALEQMFDNITADTGMAFVVVQHLSPDFKSLMSELLARHTEMPIHRVADGMRVEPNSIYLIPPKKEMIISDGRLLLTDKDLSQGLTLPIDHFFRSLAQDTGRYGVALVLSGTGSDGSRGIRDIHEAGGLVIAQSEASAKFDGMPKSAEDTGIVDVRIEPGKIGDLLQRYIRHPLRSQWKASEEQPVDESTLKRIFRLLQQRHKIDFSYYKPATIGRRIERRIQLNHNVSLEEYLRHIEHDPAELNQLYKDLLIGVTRFFRDREAFELLEKKVLPNLILKARADEEIRIWVAGCATGEEAYSIAMLIHACQERLNRHPPVKVFATDVHRASLDFAHVGLYSEASIAELPASFRERYLQRINDGYEVSREIRQMIVFAPHNLIKDAPFTHLHLISCRNMLIYLRSIAQKKALSLFHFGLRTGGVLFLGSSESPGELAEEFETLDEHNKLFAKRRDIRLPADLWAFPLESSTARGSQLPVPSAAPHRDQQLLATYDDLLARFMPPGLLVNDRREVLHMFAGAGKYLKLADGRMSNDLLEMLEGDLKLAVTGGFQRISKGEKQICFERVRIASSAAVQFVKLTLSALPRVGDGLTYLITLEELEPPRVSPDGDVIDSIDVSEISRDQLQSLELELRYTKENLQATIEELETSNEELQATNEELVASNEELQSTNEELHSVNEELYTVNAEHQKKIAELTELTNDMDNLLVSTEVHTLFLDAELCIRKFTPDIAKVFSLIPQDIGRRIDGFVHKIDFDRLPEKLSEVLQNEERFENEVRDNRGNSFLMRILPYREEAGTAGVVLTLVDITHIKKVEEHFRIAVEASPAGMVMIDRQARIVMVNSQTEELFGYDREDLVGMPLTELMPPRFRTQHLSDSIREYFHDPQPRLLSTAADFCGLKNDGTEFPVDVRLNPLETADGLFVLGAVIDITQRRSLENSLRERVEQRDRFLAVLSHELRNPLGAMLNATYVLDADQSDEQRRVDAYRVVQRQARHMGTLLNDLVDVARVSSGHIKLNTDSIDLIQSVPHAVETVQPLVESRGQRIEVQIPGHSVWIDACEDRIHQIQVNLLSNAARYSPPGETIQLAVTTDENHVYLSVKDNGIGIREEMHDAIFELFVQGDTTLDRTESGMGVGLTLVRRLVELHGGTINVNSEGTGKGSEFVVTLPAAEPPKDEEFDHKQFSASEISPEQCRVILIEDNRDAREMFVALLKLKGFEVLSAGDGVSGLDLVRSEPPHVAIIDIGLPKLDGLEVARRIRSDESLSDVVLIALTGYGQDADRDQAFAAGFNGHLTKPIDSDKLENLLRRLKLAAQDANLE